MKLGLDKRESQGLHTHLERTRDLAGSLERISALMSKVNFCQRIVARSCSVFLPSPF